MVMWQGGFGVMGDRGALPDRWQQQVVQWLAVAEPLACLRRPVDVAGWFWCPLKLSYVARQVAAADGAATSGIRAIRPFEAA